MSLAIRDREDCFAIILDDAVNDRSLAMTSSFTNMVLAGQILAHAWSFDEYKPILESLVSAGRALLPRAASLASDLAQGGYERTCFVGSGLLAGTAMESSLKVLELTAGKVQSMSQSTLGLRHGPMAALQHQTLFVIFISGQPQRRRYEIDLLREIGRKRLASTRVALAIEDSKSLRDEAEEVLKPGICVSVPDCYRPILDVLFGQLLGLFASIHYGLKPDAPSPSGAISRVVQNIGIY
jgi:tagatose-6-phosphate ketose/aldose isomerase